MVFTSGGTEADNLAIAGAWEALQASGATPSALVCTAIEHHAVLNTCRALARRHRLELREIPAGKDGLVDLDALAEACTPEVGLVSVMAVNNEIGTVQPVGAVAELVRQQAPGAVLHTDAVQAVPWLDPRRLVDRVDLVSLSAHKFGGPKGVGVLVANRGTALRPIMHGGGQERERRSGTHNVAGVVALGAALAVTDWRRDDTVRRVGALRDRLGDGLLASVPGATRRPIGPTGWPASATSGSPASRARPWWSSWTRAACPSRPGQPAPAARWRPATCSPRWACPSTRRAAGCGSRSAPPPPGPTSTGPWRSSRLPWPSCETEPMRVLVAMSGGVDSSVAAALAAEEFGRDQVVGATLKLWGGASDSGCCSVADVEDARRVADRLGLVHHVFNFSAEFEERVVAPYVRGHAEGRTPNPCIECNRHLKFDRLLDRAASLGFDAVATGHHARRSVTADGRFRLCRGADPAKDQSYVLAMLGQHQLARALFPVGTMTKAEVREEAARLGLRTADKPDSQDVCFIRSDEGRAGFLSTRVPLHAGRLVDHASGEDLGAVEAVELVTVGQRRGMGHGGDGRRRFVTAVDVPARRVSLGPPEAALADRVDLHTLAWVDTDPTAGDRPVAVDALVQCSAHGLPVRATVRRSPNGLVVEFDAPQRRIAPGQTVALYDPARPDEVVGSGIAA